ncbi:unknown [Firmicutes bacterium CAG:424]|nr:unknown [Firmicutes bacterium CAG:424]
MRFLEVKYEAVVMVCYLYSGDAWMHEHAL